MEAPRPKVRRIAFAGKTGYTSYCRNSQLIVLQFRRMRKGTFPGRLIPGEEYRFPRLSGLVLYGGATIIPAFRMCLHSLAATVSIGIFDRAGSETCRGVPLWGHQAVSQKDRGAKLLIVGDLFQ